MLTIEQALDLDYGDILLCKYGDADKYYEAHVLWVNATVKKHNNGVEFVEIHTENFTGNGIRQTLYSDDPDQPKSILKKQRKEGQPKLGKWKAL